MPLLTAYRGSRPYYLSTSTASAFYPIHISYIHNISHIHPIALHASASLPSKHIQAYISHKFIVLQTVGGQTLTRAAVGAARASHAGPGGTQSAGPHLPPPPPPGPREGPWGCSRTSRCRHQTQTLTPFDLICRRRTTRRPPPLYSI